MIKPIELTHANFVSKLGNPEKVFVYPQYVFAIMNAPEAQATSVISQMGAQVLVKETKEEISTLIGEALDQLTTQTSKETSDE